MNSQIEDPATLEMKNVLAFHGKLSQSEIMDILGDMEVHIKELGIEKNGNPVTVTYQVFQEGKQLLMDVEIMIPVSKQIVPPQGYSFKPIFKLVNAVKIRIVGHPSLLKEGVQSLVDYVKKENYTPITPVYTETIYIPKNKAEIDNTITDLYIGVSYNIL